MVKGRLSLGIEKLATNGLAFMETQTPYWCGSLSFQIPGIMAWLKLSHLEGVPKPGCYFGLLLAARSVPFPLSAGSLRSWLPTLSTFAPCEEERIKSRRQYCHLWSTYSVKHWTLHSLYHLFIPTTLKGWYYPHVTAWELEGSEGPRVPWLVSDGGWTEPRSTCSVVTPMRKRAWESFIYIPSSTLTQRNMVCLVYALGLYLL